MPQEVGIEWKVESLRITSFLGTLPTTRSLEDWLETVSGNTPIQVTKTNNTFSGVARSSDGFLRIDWANNRIDILLLPVDPVTDNSIGNLGTLTNLFNKYVDRFTELHDFPVVDRLAVGLVLTYGIDNEAMGIELIRPAILGLRIDARARDLQYRSNIPYINPEIPSIQINRLATWSLGQVQTVQIRLGNDGSQTQEVVGLAPIAIRLELDINTDKDMKIDSDSTKCRVLLREFQRQAMNIAMFGEQTMLS
jgi:hypothetical protein